MKPPNTAAALSTGTPTTCAVAAAYSALDLPSAPVRRETGHIPIYIYAYMFGLTEGVMEIL